MRRAIQRLLRTILSLSAGVAVSALFVVTPLIDVVMKPIMTFVGTAIPGGWFRPLYLLSPGNYVDMAYDLILVVLPAIGFGAILGSILILCLRLGAWVRPLLVGFVSPALLVAGLLSIRLVILVQAGIPFALMWNLVWKRPFGMFACSYAFACLLAVFAARRMRGRRSSRLDVVSDL